MDLGSRIESRRKDIRTDGYAISIGEWISLYEKNEIDIHPEFQRFFRWTDEQKTLLIESILLGIPIPSVFVSQRPDGVWDVIDGLQRLSTILQFVGILRDEENKPVPPLVLHGTKYIPELAGVVWGDNGDAILPNDARLIFKRSKINSSIILRESDETVKFDLFQRLNTGGSQASDQEVRNCILVMLNREMFLWISRLAKLPEFEECIALSDRLVLESYDLELVLRFLIFYRMEAKYLNRIGDVGLFLTDRLRELAIDKNYSFVENERVFKETFFILQRELSDNAFRKFSTEKQKYLGGFAISQFETVACGIGYNLAQNIKPTSVETKVASLWSRLDYTNWTGSGITAARRLPRLIPLGRKIFGS